MADQATRRRALLDAVVLVVVLLLVQIVVNVVWSLLSGASLLHLGGAAVSSIIGWWPMLLAFAGVTLLVALTGWSRVTRFRLALPSAIVAWLLGQTVVTLLAGDPLPGALLWGIFGLPLFLVVAFVAGLIAAPVAAAVLPAGPPEPSAVTAPGDDRASSLPPRPPAEPVQDRTGRPAASVVRAIALGAAILLTLSLPWQWFRVYFRFPGGSEPDPTAAQGAQYLATVLVAFGLLVLAGVLASRQERSVIGTVVAAGVLVVVAVLCQVPAGTVWLDPGSPGEPGPAPGEPGGGITEDCAWDASRPGCGG